MLSWSNSRKGQESSYEDLLPNVPRSFHHISPIWSNYSDLTRVPHPKKVAFWKGPIPLIQGIFWLVKYSFHPLKPLPYDFAHAQGNLRNPKTLRDFASQIRCWAKTRPIESEARMLKLYLS